MLDVAVYLYIAGYHWLDPCDTQYGHKVTCHFLIIPTLVIDIKIVDVARGTHCEEGVEPTLAYDWSVTDEWSKNDLSIEGMGESEYIPCQTEAD